MGARKVAQIIGSSRYVSNIKWTYDSKLEFDYERDMDYEPTNFKIYMPSRDDYEITIAVVDIAIEYGANFIVYDNWIKPTISGKSYAINHGIKVYSYGQFLRKVNNGESLGND